MAKIIDGNLFSGKIRDRITLASKELRDYHNLTPGLAVVLVGEDPASQVYVRNKKARAIEVGFNSFEHILPVSATEDELLLLIKGLNHDPKVHGILVQLPLPSHIDSAKVIEAIDPRKDVDGFHPYNVGQLSLGGEGMIPCTPFGCLLMLKEFVGNLSGKHAVVLGRSNIVGKPMAQLLLRESCTVTVAHSRTRDIEALAKSADILVAAIGKPEMVKGSWIKEGAAVIDVGINRITLPDGKSKLVGDVAFAEAQHAGAITPVPGGVGPMTIAMLLSNTLGAALKIHKLPHQPLID